MEDKNHFLIEFLNTSEDYENQISIRSTVIDFIEDVSSHFDFDRATLKKVIAAFV